MDVAAPGEQIYSTFPTGIYATWEGTSMATPFVSGQAALVRGLRPNMPAQAPTGQQSVSALISSTARSLDASNPDYVGKLGAGHADLGASLKELNTAPEITDVQPASGSQTVDRTPLVGATVLDAQSDLAKPDIALSIDGKGTTNFSYDAATGRLSYESSRLRYGQHTVEVVASDPQGLVGRETWTFEVIRE